MMQSKEEIKSKGPWIATCLVIGGLMTFATIIIGAIGMIFEDDKSIIIKSCIRTLSITLMYIPIAGVGSYYLFKFLKLSPEDKAGLCAITKRRKIIAYIAVSIILINIGINVYNAIFSSDAKYLNNQLENNCEFLDNWEELYGESGSEYDIMTDLVHIAGVDKKLFVLEFNHLLVKMRNLSILLKGPVYYEDFTKLRMDEYIGDNQIIIDMYSDCRAYNAIIESFIISKKEPLLDEKKAEIIKEYKEYYKKLINSATERTEQQTEKVIWPYIFAGMYIFSWGYVMWYFIVKAIYKANIKKI